MKFTSKSKLFAVLILATFLVGCSYIETSTQIRDVAYLRFVGNISQDYTVVVNDRHTFKLNPCAANGSTGDCIDNTSKKLFEVKSGNVNIKITDSDKKIILEKSMYLGAGNTAEVNL